MRPLALAALLFVLSIPASIHAQTIDPNDMVSGVDSVLISKDFYTVPAGQVLVLTDLAVLNADVTLFDDGVPRFQRVVQGGGFTFGTGLLFHSGHHVGIYSPAAYNGLKFAWSGYLVNVVVGVAPSDQADERLGFRLGPNPSGGDAVELRFELTRPTDLSLRIYDVSGRLVTTLADARLPAGRHDLAWNGTNGNGEPVASGVYFARLESAKANTVRRLVRLR